MTSVGAVRPRSSVRLGRTFVGPVFDPMVIGGGLSLLMMAVLFATGFPTRWTFSKDAVAWAILLSNSAHFAASTIRLYTKPGAFRDLPVMTMYFPLLAVVIVTLGLCFPEMIGRQLFALYQSWSAYHYAAQTFGLASMYAGRSSCNLDGADRRLLWWMCMLPFAYSFLGGENFGLGWFVPPTVYAELPLLIPARNALTEVVGVLVFALPVVLMMRLSRNVGTGLPLISVLLIFTNGIWWIVFSYMSAFVWATIFHGVQYLGIVIIFHLRDHPPRNPGQWRWVGPAIRFYGISLALGYLLFEVWPYAYTLMGFTFSESVLVTSAAINIHHFVVDRGIWQIRRDPANQRAAIA